MPQFTRYYLFETEADSVEEANAIFDDEGPEVGPQITTLEWGASILHKPVDPGVTVIVCVRDPDWDNAFEVFPGDQPGVEIFDIDLGRSDLTHEDELADWKASHGIEIERLRAGGHTAAADHYQSIIDAVEAD
jgi:hypothetical protein